MSLSLSLEDVENVADLARLGLSDEEKEWLRHDLSLILDHIAVLNQLETDTIPPTAQVTALTNVLREDTVRPSLTPEQVFANTAHQADGFFEVPAVLAAVDTEEEEPIP